MTPRIPPIFSAALSRRIAKATLHRSFRPINSPPLPSLRSIQTSSSLLSRKSPIKAYDPNPSSTALSALLARLSLPANSSLHAALLACLTHHSYTSAPPSTTETAGSSSSSSTTSTPTNAVLAELGNSLLGLFTSEHVSHLYPELPTEALKSAVTAFVGPKACVSVARELGISVTSKISEKDQGVPVKWRKQVEMEELPRARRQNGVKQEESDTSVGGSEGFKRKETWEDIVSSVVRAFVGLIYQEQGIHAAKSFVQSHFLSRHLDMTTLFNFKNPKHVLSNVVTKHLVTAGVQPGSPESRVESRLIASTGVHSQAPLFNIGLFLPSGVKLSEGHGSSLKMAEHRAAVNALHSFFLVRSDAGRINAGTDAISRPTEAHEDRVFTDKGIPRRGLQYAGRAKVVAEALVESSRNRVRR